MTGGTITGGIVGQPGKNTGGGGNTFSVGGGAIGVSVGGTRRVSSGATGLYPASRVGTGRGAKKTRRLLSSALHRRSSRN